MPLTAAEKATKRYRECLANGAEPPQPRTSANAALLDAVRAEIAAGSEHVQAFTASGAKRVKQNTEVNDAAPVLEEEPARAIEAPSDAADRTRLWQLVWQLDMVNLCIKHTAKCCRAQGQCVRSTPCKHRCPKRTAGYNYR